MPRQCPWDGQQPTNGAREVQLDMPLLDVPIPKGWDATFAELTFEELSRLIGEADRSRVSTFRQQVTIETPRRWVTITIESEPK